MILYANDDQDKLYGIDQEWQDQPAPAGISFMIRSRSEERTLEMAIQSLQSVSVPHEILLVMNGPETEIPPEWPVRHLTYSPAIGRAGVENLVTPADSIHSLVWFSNWCLSKTRYSYILKFDADMVASRLLIDQLPAVLAGPVASCAIKLVYADTLMVNEEAYLFPKEPGPYYESYYFWELMKMRRPCAEVRLSGSILHDTSLVSPKEYSRPPAWWVGTEQEEELERKCQRIVDRVGIRFARASDPETAVAEYKLVALLAEEKASDDPSAYNFLKLSAAWYHACQYRNCISAAEKAIELNRDFAQAFNNISAAHLMLSNWDEAIAAANEAIRLQPDLQLAKTNLAAATQKKEAQQLENLSKLEIELSDAYYRAERFSDCITAARKAIELKPDFPEAYNNVCAASNKLARFAEGKKAGEEAVRLAPNVGLYRNNLDMSINGLEKSEAQ
jgi:tetratricopeptide (TPR) repeat protein